MKATEIREKTVQELTNLLLESEKSLLTLNIKKSTGQLKQTHLIRETRKDIARIKTELNAR